MQNESETDLKMQNMIESKSIDEEIVLSWMHDCRLLQGVKSNNRTELVNVYASLIFGLTSQVSEPSADQIAEIIKRILSEFYTVVRRNWLGASSKLLWCSFPDSVVPYDAAVHRTLIVLQGVTPYLTEMPRIKTIPSVKSAADIDSVIEFYINYQNMVLAIKSEHQIQLNNLRYKNREKYPHDIRVIEKLLWILGNPNQSLAYGYTSGSEP